MNQATKQQIKYALKIKNNASFRKKEKKVFIEGLNNIQELVSKKPNSVETIFVNTDSKTPVPFTTTHNNKCLSVNKVQAKKLSFQQKPFVVSAVINLNIVEQSTKFSYQSGLYVGLVNVQDPFNMGTIFRTCEAFNVDGILLFNNCVNPYNQKVVISSTGSVFKVPFKTFESVYNFINKQKGVNVYGTSVKNATNYKNVSIKTGVILFGNEGVGLSEKVLSKTTNNLYIPINNIDSLNIGVSVGVILANLKN